MILTIIQRNPYTAWWVQEHPDAEWGLFVHAATPGQAKTKFIEKTPGDYDSSMFTDLRVYRQPKLDNHPFTDEFAPLPTPDVYGNEEEIYETNYWLQFCDCVLCTKAKEALKP